MFLLEDTEGDIIGVFVQCADCQLDSREEINWGEFQCHEQTMPEATKFWNEMIEFVRENI